ncbi:MAG: DNA repair exonuclease, partial [Rhodobacterales bacterium]|nr:DNA repair exonuclease [Rhodobacterales bacterium]
MSTQLLFVGDIHLGRQPDRLADVGPDTSALAPTEAWKRVVTYALDNAVSAVVLAGDVVDNDRDRFEAYGHLERGIQRLAAADIPVIAVAGNHDGIVLPRLAKSLGRSGFKLLGVGAKWERIELGSDPPVDLLGWSFPSRHSKANPLRSPGLAESIADRRPTAALLGVLHTDLGGGASSPYAPVSASELEQEREVDGWFLGHIHKPGELHTARPIGYLGSLVGLDRGETGARGPWLVTVEGRGQVSAKQVPLGPVHWEAAEIDVTDMPEDTAGAEDFLRTCVQEHFMEMQRDRPELTETALRVVAVSITFTGQPKTGRHVQAFIEQFTPATLCFGHGSQTWAAAKLTDRTRAPVDLQRLMS